MLLGPPSDNHLARLYFELALHGAISQGEAKRWPYKPKSIEELFCLAAMMSRYDPRLVTILTSFLADHWQRLNPYTIRTFYPIMKTSQTVAVLAEFLLHSKTIESEFRFFLEYLQRGLTPVPSQLYFLHLYTPGGHLLQRAIDMPLAEYKRWGFLAREAPVIDRVLRHPLGQHDKASRKNILRRLFASHKRVLLADYLQALEHRISRQQALSDMRAFPNTRRIGRGRGSAWALTKTPR